MPEDSSVEDVQARRLGVVLGGAGDDAIAWTTGVLAGAVDAGLALSHAACIVGTSAAALPAARLARRHDPRVDARRIDEGNGRKPLGAPRPWAEALERVRELRAGAAGLPEAECRRVIGRVALGGETVTETRYVSTMFDCLAPGPWPAALRIAAVDSLTGDDVTLDWTSGVSLARAVAAAASWPCWLPPVTCGERRCIDAAIDSATNCDRLAAGLDAVLVIAAVAENPPPGSWDEEWRARLDAEVAALSAPAVVVTPGLDGLAVEAGRAQGRDAAARLERPVSPPVHPGT